jgi:uroporphyrinogen decarboxylase
VKIERVKDALAGKAVDRPPVSVWMHFPAVDQDSLRLAETQVAFQKQYDYDFIKLMPFGLYSAQDWGCQVQFFCDDTHSPVVYKHGINHSVEWQKLRALSPEFGNWGQLLQLAEYTMAMVGDDVPVIQTYFSPLTTAYKLAGDRLLKDMTEYPEWVHQGLRVIAETTKKSIIANAKAGIAGVFFATQCATADLMSAEMYDDFGRAYDIPLLETAKDCGLWFNMLHIHGDNIFFKELLDYPVDALNWHDQQVFPSLKEARAMTDLCLVGGLHEKGVISKGRPEDVVWEICTSLQHVGTERMMIAPGCVTDPNPPKANLYAARLAVEPGMCKKAAHRERE